MVLAELADEVLRRLLDGLSRRAASRDSAAVRAMEFFAEPVETPGLLEKLAAQAPQNPFCGPGYFRAMKFLGADPWIVGLREGERLVSAAGVFIKHGRLNSTLEIV